MTNRFYGSFCVVIKFVLTTTIIIIIIIIILCTLRDNDGTNATAAPPARTALLLGNLTARTRAGPEYYCIIVIISDDREQGTRTAQLYITPYYISVLFSYIIAFLFIIRAYGRLFVRYAFYMYINRVYECQRQLPFSRNVFPQRNVIITKMRFCRDGIARELYCCC